MIRLVLRSLAIALILLSLIPFHFAWKFAGRPSHWPRRALRWVGWTAGLRIRAEGRPLERDVLFLANHVSWLDILLVAGTGGAAFVSKAEVRRWPVIGWLATLNDTVFVERSARRGVKGQVDALREALGRGQAVALFAEGTTEGGHEVLPFRASLLGSLYPRMPGVRVQPVALDYRDAHDIAWLGEESAPANARRILSRRGTIPVRIRYLEPIDPGEFEDRKALAVQARLAILDALDAFEAERPALYGRDEDRRSQDVPRQELRLPDERL